MCGKRDGPGVQTFDSYDYPMLNPDSEFYLHSSRTEIFVSILDNLTKFVLDKYNSDYRTSDLEVEIRIGMEYIHDGDVDWKDECIKSFSGKEDNTNELYFKSSCLFQQWFHNIS